MVSSVIISKVDVNSLQPSPTGSVSFSMNSDEILYKMDENSTLVPIINIGPTGPNGLTGSDGNAGDAGIGANGVNGYNLENNWHKPTCFYGDPMFNVNTNGLGGGTYYTTPQTFSNKGYQYLTWMYEYVVTSSFVVDAIGTLFGSNSGGGSYKLFIYDSGTHSPGYSHPVNLLYESSQLTYATQGFRYISTSALTLTPGVYWIGIMCGDESGNPPKDGEVRTGLELAGGGGPKLNSLSYFNVVSPVNIKSILGNDDKDGDLSPSYTGLILDPYNSKIPQEITEAYSRTWYNSGMPDPMPEGIMEPSMGLLDSTSSGRVRIWYNNYLSPYPIYLRKTS